MASEKKPSDPFYTFHDSHNSIAFYSCILDFLSLDQKATSPHSDGVSEEPFMLVSKVSVREFP